MKWTSKAAKPLVEAISVKVLSGDYGNIFEPGFDTKEFPYKELYELEQDWVEAFSSKQFRQNTEAMIKRYIKEGN